MTPEFRETLKNSILGWKAAGDSPQEALSHAQHAAKTAVDEDFEGGKELVETIYSGKFGIAEMPGGWIPFTHPFEHKTEPDFVQKAPAPAVPAPIPLAPLPKGATKKQKLAYASAQKKAKAAAAKLTATVKADAAKAKKLGAKVAKAVKADAAKVKKVAKADAAKVKAGAKKLVAKAKKAMKK